MPPMVLKRMPTGPDEVGTSGSLRLETTVREFMQVATDPTAGSRRREDPMTDRVRRAALAVATVAALAVVAWALLPSGSVGPSAMPLRGTSVSWQLNHGYGGPGFDPRTAMTTTVVPIEVDYPTCITNGFGHWFDATVSYTSATVTIQVVMTPTAAAGCPAQAYPHVVGSLPTVGGYLSGIYYAVHLREPLGGRALFDGSTFPASARPYG
jgi:hypothetical protein